METGSRAVDFVRHWQWKEELEMSSFWSGFRVRVEGACQLPVAVAENENENFGCRQRKYFDPQFRHGNMVSYDCQLLSNEKTFTAANSVV